MDCVNHSGVSAAAYCQNCGKALCSNCVRKAAGGQIFCEPCWVAWTTAAGAQRPFVPPPPGAPSPRLAAFLGLIPGVGAMYNGQFIKGLIHIGIFAVLVSAANVYDVFGFFIAGWIFYQVFEAYHTAKARRDGEPLPDPLGLNEIGNLFGSGGRMHPGAGAEAAKTEPVGGYEAPGQAARQGAQEAQYRAPYQAPYQGPSQAPWQTPYQGPAAPPPAGFSGPDIPAVPPMHWRRREPIGAVILIALGLLFLLRQFDWFSGKILEYGWPVGLIALGVWLIVRRLRDSHASTQGNSQGGSR